MWSLLWLTIHSQEELAKFDYLVLTWVAYLTTQYSFGWLIWLLDTHLGGLFDCLTVRPQREISQIWLLHTSLGWLIWLPDHPSTRGINQIWLLGIHLGGLFDYLTIPSTRGISQIWLLGTHLGGLIWLPEHPSTRGISQIWVLDTHLSGLFDYFSHFD
jgi:hypothetical protein